MICERYVVVVVPFPFDDLPVTKRRPVVVLSAKAFNQANGHTLVAMITSAKDINWPSDVWIEDLEIAGLRQPCVARLRFQTMPNNLLIRQIGKFGALDRIRCEKQLAEMLF